MRHNRICAWIALVLAVMLLFSACTGETPEEIAGQPENGENKTGTALSLTLPYYENDALNPYFAVSALNRALASLFCEPLYRVNADYSASAVLAQSASTVDLSCIVTLNSAVFSDGSEVTVSDVVYSFNLAKASDWYGTRLSNIASAEARGSTVVFTLLAPDLYVQNLLSFPIVRRGTADAAAQVPTGSGAFILSAEGQLTKNPHAASGAVESVTLLHIKDPDNLGNALEIGNIDYMFEDFADGAYTRIVAQNTFVTMNHLVYLGINSSVGALQSAAVRTAIYYAADKDDVAASSYRGCATAAGLPFHPAFCTAQGLTNGATAADPARASEILNKLGYNRYDKNGLLTNGQNTLQMTILVNNENSFRMTAAYNLVENLKTAGFSVTVESVSAADYTARIASGDFTLYIGEIKLAENLSLSPFFGGSATAGINTELPVFAAYTALCKGETDLAGFASAFLDDMPFVPLCYRAGMAAYSKEVQPDFSTAAYDAYGDITKWTSAS